MYIEAIVVCVNYTDFLSETLPLNKHHFDHMIVVTAAGDVDTQKLCEYHNVEWTTADFGPRGEFRKGVGINAGLEKLSMQDWVVHLDADVVLPPQFREIIQSLHLSRLALYGCDRFLMKSYKSWAKHKRRPKLINEMHTYVHTEAYPIATRFMSYDYMGYIPVGFFQMWNPNYSKIWKYPQQHTDAGRTDMLFARKWARVNRQLLAEIVAFHLESELVPQGTNWAGRRTKPFRQRNWWQMLCDWWLEDGDPVKQLPPPKQSPPPNRYFSEV
jgi:hypothetical protein